MGAVEQPLDLVHVRPHARKALTENELRHFLSQLPNEWRLFFELLAHTGLRIGEAVALQWDDIDLGKRRLHVRRRLYRSRLDTPKSDYGLRTIPLSAGVAQQLWTHRRHRPGSQPVFASATGGYHDPGHTCATTLFNHGLNAKQVQHWLGHHSPAFTLATYIHQLPNQLPDPDFLDMITHSDDTPSPAPSDGTNLRTKGILTR